MPKAQPPERPSVAVRPEIAVPFVSWEDLAARGVPPEVLAVREEIVNLPSEFKERLLVVYCQLKGVTPLLQHRPALRAEKKQRGEKYDPVQEAERFAYRHPIHGWLYVKNDAIRAFLRDFSLAFNKKRTADAFLRSIDAVRPMMIPLLDPDTEFYVQAYEIQEYVGMFNPRVGRVVQWRPLIPRWRLDFLVLLNLWHMDADALVEILFDSFRVGGRVVGIGAWRPLIVKSGRTVHTGGEFGKFIVTDFALVEMNEG
jgi:hypothetical protein